jgi:hypothetical protein
VGPVYPDARPNILLINDIHLKNRPGHVELSADLDGLRLWYRLPADLPARLTANPFVAAGFFPAAVTGEPIIVASEFGVSPQLKSGLSYLQQVFGCWNSELKPFSVQSESTPDTPAIKGTAAFFSGGMDGLYTLLLHSEEITHLVYINGFDFRLKTEVFAASKARLVRLRSISTRR